MSGHNKVYGDSNIGGFALSGTSEFNVEKLILEFQIAILIVSTR